MKPRVWLVTEYNCHLPEPDRASVWVSGRPLSPDKELADDVARLLAGPMPSAEARRLVGVLRQELQAAGVEVIEEVGRRTTEQGGQAR
jgi:hypothetical protein